MSLEVRSADLIPQSGNDGKSPAAKENPLLEYVYAVLKQDQSTSEQDPDTSKQDETPRKGGILSRQRRKAAKSAEEPKDAKDANAEPKNETRSEPIKDAPGTGQTTPSKDNTARPATEKPEAAEKPALRPQVPSESTITVKPFMNASVRAGVKDGLVERIQRNNNLTAVEAVFRQDAQGNEIYENGHRIVDGIISQQFTNAGSTIRKKGETFYKRDGDSERYVAVDNKTGVPITGIAPLINPRLDPNSNFSFESAANPGARTIIRGNGTPLDTGVGKPEFDFDDQGRFTMIKPPDAALAQGALIIRIPQYVIDSDMPAVITEQTTVGPLRNAFTQSTRRGNTQTWDVQTPYVDSRDGLIHWSQNTYTGPYGFTDKGVHFYNQPVKTGEKVVDEGEDAEDDAQVDGRRPQPKKPEKKKEAIITLMEHLIHPSGKQENVALNSVTNRPINRPAQIASDRVTTSTANRPGSSGDSATHGIANNTQLVDANGNPVSSYSRLLNNGISQIKESSASGAERIWTYLPDGRWIADEATPVLGQDGQPRRDQAGQIQMEREERRQFELGNGLVKFIDKQNAQHTLIGRGEQIVSRDDTYVTKNKFGDIVRTGTRDTAEKYHDHWELVHDRKSDKPDDSTIVAAYPVVDGKRQAEPVWQAQKGEEGFVTTDGEFTYSPDKNTTVVLRPDGKTLKFATEDDGSKPKLIEATTQSGGKVTIKPSDDPAQPDEMIASCSVIDLQHPGHTIQWERKLSAIPIDESQSKPNGPPSIRLYNLTITRTRIDEDGKAVARETVMPKPQAASPQEGEGKAQTPKVVPILVYGVSLTRDGQIQATVPDPQGPEAQGPPLSTRVIFAIPEIPAQLMGTRLPEAARYARNLERFNTVFKPVRERLIEQYGDLCLQETAAI